MHIHETKVLCNVEFKFPNTIGNLQKNPRHRQTFINNFRQRSMQAMRHAIVNTKSSK